VVDVEHAGAEPHYGPHAVQPPAFVEHAFGGNRVVPSYEAILDHCCAAWNKLTDQPWRIMSIGLRDWAHGF
jgi:hypothetical protein